MNFGGKKRREDVWRAEQEKIQKSTEAQHEKAKQAAIKDKAMNQQEPVQVIPPAGSAPAEAPQPLTVVTLAPTFLRTLSSVLPSFGTSTQDPPGSGNPVVNVTYSTAITIPSTVAGGVATPVTGGFARPRVAGYVRFKAFGAGTVTAVLLTATDGTNTETLYSETLASTGVVLSATASLCRLLAFESDINPTSFTLTLTGGAGATVSVEAGGSAGF